MENKPVLETIQLTYAAEKAELMKKIGVLVLCMAGFFAFGKLVMGDESFREILEFAFTFTMILYLPFKICFRVTGSVIMGIIAALVLTLIICFIFGGNNILLAIFLFGGLALDFGSSIYKLVKLRNLLTDGGDK